MNEQKQYPPLPNLDDFKSTLEIHRLPDMCLEEKVQQIRYWLRRRQKEELAAANAAKKS